MLLLLMHEHYPEKSRIIAALQVSATESDHPAPGTYDVLLDLRTLADQVEPRTRFSVVW